MYKKLAFIFMLCAISITAQKKQSDKEVAIETVVINNFTRSYILNVLKK